MTEAHTALTRLPAVFLPAPLPRDGRLAFWDPAGGELPEAASARHEELTVVRRHGRGVRSASVPALTLPVEDALPVLLAAAHRPGAHPATVCWGAAAGLALHLVARGRLLPGLTPEDCDAWRAGPWTLRTSRTCGRSPPPFLTRDTPRPSTASSPSNCPNPKPCCVPA